MRRSVHIERGSCVLTYIYTCLYCFLFVFGYSFVFWIIVVIMGWVLLLWVGFDTVWLWLMFVLNLLLMDGFETLVYFIY